MAGSALPERLLQALSTIHTTTPRLIHAPPATSGRQKRASVAIILRVRPSSSPIASTSSSSSCNHAGPSTSPTLQHFQDSSLLRSRVQSTSSLSEANGGGSGAPPLTPSLARLQDLFALPWVQSGTPEILYIKRASRASDRWSSHIAFPGGRQEPDDENSLYTAMRETWEEVGIDLAEKKDYLEVGQLDDREITTSLGKRLLMVLSPFVFLHTSPDAPVPDIQASEVASAHWVPLSCLLSPHVRWGDVRIDITSRITPRNKAIRKVLALLIGNMHFKCILLPNEPILSSPIDSPPSQLLDPPNPEAERPSLRLWGLTLGMSLDLLSHMSLPTNSEPGRTIAADAAYGNNSPTSNSMKGFDFSVPPSTPHASYPPLLAPSMTSIFPTFKYPDVNLFIWMFGARYRHAVKRWSERLNHSRPPTPGTMQSSPHAGRVNFAGMALNQFYAAVRKALILAVILRASVLLGGIGAATLWLSRQIKRKRALARL